MNIIGRIKLPKSVKISDLYVQCSKSALISDQSGVKEVALRQGETISSSSYFNSIYENYYAKYTALRSIYHLLKLEGDFKISACREVHGTSQKEIISEEIFQGCQLFNPVKLSPIDLLQDENAGRIYLEITCLSEQGIFRGGSIATDEPKLREISLGIVICTFKKENYIRNTLSAILQDELLQNKNFKVFVVDNGQTLDKHDFKDPRVKLISNKNAGGSGGFTRGLIEGLAENVCSHFLLMDDDIELESESICRLFSVHEYAKFDFVIAGGLLNLNEKHELYEAGATFNYGPKFRKGIESLTALNHRIDLRSTDSLNQLLVEEEPDFGGFWFCSFSRATVEKNGLPLPLFIKLDDVEFCLRAKNVLGLSIVTFPSMAVWHIPSSAKKLNWEAYYFFRNDLITFAMHRLPNYSYTVGNFTQGIANALLKFDYDRAHMIIKAFEDYLKGPDFLKNSAPEILHPNILKLSRSYESQDQINRFASVQLLMRWFKVVAKASTEWSSVTAAWKDASEEITSVSFWQQYLEVKQAAQLSATRR